MFNTKGALHKIMYLSTSGFFVQKRGATGIGRSKGRGLYLFQTFRRRLPTGKAKIILFPSRDG